MESIKDKIEKLRDIIRYHDRKYYVDNAPEISDQEYDKLMHQLIKLEKEHPEFITPDSPTQRVGGEPSKEFPAVKHKVPMLSMDNTYSAEELREFDKRVKRFLGESDVEYVVELKMDGVSVSVIYENGIFVKGSTRGDGVQGDDVTANLKTITRNPINKKPGLSNL